LSTDTPNPPAASVWNVPNQLSAARLLLAIGCFIAMAWDAYWLALVSFVLAAITDWADGYWARTYNQVTQLGRILDPFADKVVVCGAFIYLAAIAGSHIVPWMAVVVVSRELLVTALRSLVEQSGGDFSAKWAGKWKMVLQCASVIGSLWLLASGGESPSLGATLDIVVWATIALTLYSGWGYVRLATQMMRR